MLTNQEFSARIAPLANLIAKWRVDYPQYIFPNFDSLDGGTEARVLILLQDPGPQVLQTSLISRDNPDPTAHNLRDFLANAGLKREDTVIWNFIPWHLDGKSINKTHRSAARPYLLEMLNNTLTEVEVVILCGNEAHRAEKWILDDLENTSSKRKYKIIKVCHPGNIPKHANRAKWDNIGVEFLKISQYLKS